jgi:branched-subunit amino acid transport protein
MWIAVLVVGAASYLFRLVPVLLMSRVDVPVAFDRRLRHAGTAAMSALGAAQVVHHGEQFGAASAAIAAVGVGVACGLAMRGRSALVAVGAGLSVYAAVTAVIGV